MRSIMFAVKGNFDKILNGSKTLTIRAIYIPTYVRGDTILLKEVEKVKDKRITLRHCKTKVSHVKPIMLKDITDDIAKREGFNNANESKFWLVQQYNIKSKFRWLFATCWGRIWDIQQTLEAFK